MRWQLAVISTAVLVFIINAAPFSNAYKSGPSTRVIYGEDDRRDLFEVDDPSLVQLADSTVSLIRAARIEPNGAITNIKTNAFGASMNLCANEPFYSQVAAPFCSGFLVAPDVIVTAGHCVGSQASCEATRFVFGFSMKDPSTNLSSVPSSEVYSCSQLIKSAMNPSGEDFAIVRLDRPVTGHTPLILSQSVPNKGEGLTVMGHPSGLPLKIAPNASVRELKSEFLVANLDTYGGNSGSAVFNSTTGFVEGILVRGETDYVLKNGCMISNRCAEDSCRGEDVTLIKQVIAHLPSN